MSLSSGTRIGPYEVVGPLGAGGMGEVYRARDTSLDRDVALKILPEAFADDPERLERFEREAKALAALNHPNIAQVYGLEGVGPVRPAGQADGAASAASDPRPRAIAMELVEGQTLEAAIGGTGIPVADALPIARQIADALEAAHERGVIHRDLKPANVMLTADGQVKVLDFGLAKATDASSSAGSVSESPTLTARATQMGMIIGTAAYMSPEQARGKSVDRRADVWAFGAVLYEMLTGQRAFAGPEITDVLARVIEREVDFGRLPPATPPAIRRLLERCLTKDPKRRLRDIGEARVTIDDVVAGRDGGGATPADGATPVRRATPVLPWALAGALAVLSAFLLTQPSGTAPEATSMSVALTLPADVEFYSTPTLSADGSVAAFVGVREGVRQIYVRRLDGFNVVPLPGSEAASVCTLSADGASIAFVTTLGQLIRMSIDGSVSQQLATSADYNLQIAWGADNRIVFGRDGVLWSVPSSGGDAAALTALDPERGETRHQIPVVSDGAAHLFYQSQAGPAGSTPALKALEFATGTVTVVAEDDSEPVWATADRIVLARDGALFTSGIRNGRLTSPPVRVYDEVAENPGGGPTASMSSAGTLLAASAEVSRGRLFWVSMNGVETPVGGPLRNYTNPRLSPDGRLVLFSGGGGLWSLDIVRGALTRLAPRAQFPLWVDSTRIAYRVPAGVVTMRSDGTGRVEPLGDTGVTDYPASVSPDGTTLALVRILPATSGDVYVVPLDGSGAARPFVATAAYEGGAQFSPDGQWMAYTSDESGRPEVYITPYPAANRRIPVSSDGALHPLWNDDGRQLFYRSGQRMMVVDVTLGDEPRLSPPRVLFDRQYKFGPNLSVPHYSLGRDGQSLLMVKEEPGARSLNLITNWLDSVTRGR